MIYVIKWVYFWIDKVRLSIYNDDEWVIISTVNTKSNFISFIAVGI